MALDWLKSKLSEGKSALLAEVGRFKNREFMEATVATCVLIAYADGQVSPEEKQKMYAYFQQSDALSVFKTDDIINSYQKIASKFEFDPQIGELEALQIIGKLRKNDAAARVLLRVSLLIANSDGSFDEEEKKMISKVAKELGLSPEEFLSV